MPTKRSPLSEIEEIRRRNPLPTERTWNLGWAAMTQLEAVEACMLDTSEDHPELWKFFVIGLVTSMENAFRLSIQFLIDSGDPYSKRASKLTDFKFRIEDILDMKGKRVSVGALIGHLVSINSIEDIDHHMSVLLSGGDDEFLRILEKARKPDDEVSDIEGWCGPLLENPESVRRFVSQAFKQRHIYVHELCPSDRVIPADVREMFSYGKAFVRATLSLIDQILFPGMTARTQAAMNDGAYRTLSEAKQRMDTAYAALSTKNIDKKRLEAAQKAWERYFEAHMKFSPNPYSGGSASPLFDAPARASLYEQRALTLEHDMSTVEWMETL